MKFAILTAFFALSISLISAQPNIPEMGDIYNDQDVPRIDITIPADSLTWIYDNPESDIEFHADFAFTSAEIQESFDDVGFRLRGNTSRQSAKKSFKVSFNTFVDGGDFHGFEKMNLNGEHNDPSICRSKIGWDLARMIGLPGSRANHVALYINDQYYGLYINVEHTDEEFTDEYLDNKNGNLYKCLWPADLVWKGSDPNQYKEEFSGRRAYDLKTNESLDDYSGLRDFIDVLNNTSASTFQSKLNEAFNTPDYLKYMALEIILGHWDDYIYNKNNYYLYDNPLTGKFEYLLYDLDNTMGIDWSGINWESRNIYQWAADWESRPLYENIMNNQILRDQFTYYIKEIAAIITDSDYLASIEALKERIRPFVVNDPYYPLDYGYTINTFDQSFNETVGSHVKKGLFPYLSQRAQSVLSQAEDTDMYPVIKYPDWNSPGAYNPFMVTVFVEDNNADLTVSLLYRFNGSEEFTEELFDDGLHNDGAAGDNFYGGSIEATGSTGMLSFNIRATDNADQSLYAFDMLQNVAVAEGGDYSLYINEFMADNETTIADEYGEYDDWFEIWNGGSTAINLAGMALSDDPDEPSKWILPEYTIQPGTFLLIWADEDTEQGDMHATFKLSKNGEYIGLYDVEQSGFALIDAIEFDEQQSDVSYGREEDGSIVWAFMPEATPGASNNGNGIEQISNVSFSVWPVPATSQLTVTMPATHTNSRFDIYNSRGQKVEEFIESGESHSVDISGFASGVYLMVEVNSGNAVKFIKQN